MNQGVDIDQEKAAKRLVLISPVAIRNAFKLAVVNGILFEDVAEGALETLSEPSLILLGLLVVGSIFTRYRSCLMMRGRPVTGRTTGHRARQGF